MKMIAKKSNVKANNENQSIKKPMKSKEQTQGIKEKVFQSIDNGKIR